MICGAARQGDQPGGAVVDFEILAFIPGVGARTRDIDEVLSGCRNVDPHGEAAVFTNLYVAGAAEICKMLVIARNGSVAVGDAQFGFIDQLVAVRSGLLNTGPFELGDLVESHGDLAVVGHFGLFIGVQSFVPGFDGFKGRLVRQLHGGGKALDVQDELFAAG